MGFDRQCEKFIDSLPVANYEDIVHILTSDKIIYRDVDDSCLVYDMANSVVKHNLVFGGSYELYFYARHYTQIFPHNTGIYSDTSDVKQRNYGRYKKGEEDYIWIRLRKCIPVTRMILLENVVAKKALGDCFYQLQRLHAAGFVHMDIKTNNIVMSKEGDFYLIDFELVLQMNDLPISPSYDELTQEHKDYHAMFGIYKEQYAKPIMDYIKLLIAIFNRTPADCDDPVFMDLLKRMHPQFAAIISHIALNTASVSTVNQVQ
jgi:serine/threonine protein kinase